MSTPAGSPSRGDENRDLIESVLGLGKGSIINLCFAVYRTIKDAPPADRPLLLKHAAESFGAGSSEEFEVPVLVSADELKRLQARYGDLVDEMLRVLVSNNPTVKDFYVELWGAINSPIFNTESARVFALYYCLIDYLTPYFQVGSGLKMSNDDFKTRSINLRDSIAKLLFVLQRDFPQRTEQASLILEIIKSADPPDDVVLLARMLGRIEKSVERARLRAAVERAD